MFVCKVSSTLGQKTTKKNKKQEPEIDNDFPPDPHPAPTLMTAVSADWIVPNNPMGGMDYGHAYQGVQQWV